jgi:hypothetical protein
MIMIDALNKIYFLGSTASYGILSKIPLFTFAELSGRRQGPYVHKSFFLTATAISSAPAVSSCGTYQLIINMRYPFSHINAIKYQTQILGRKHP